MKTIQVNYDLHKPVRDYDKLYGYLTSYGTLARPLQSLWLIRTNETVAQVRDTLMKYVDADDKVLVFDVTGVSWGSNFTDEHIKWMKNHIGHAQRFAA